MRKTKRSKDPSGNPHPENQEKLNGFNGIAGPGLPKGYKYPLTKERVEMEIRRIALFDPRRLIGRTAKSARTFTIKEIAELPDDVAACITSYDVVLGNENKSDGALETVIKVRWADKLKALEQCCRVLGMFKDRVIVEDLSDRKSRLRAALSAPDSNRD